MARYSAPKKRRYREKDWTVTYVGFDPGEQRLREALTTLGNGHFGTRGSATECSEPGVFYPGNYIAGVFNELPTKISGKTVYNDDMVNCPNWMFLRFRVGNNRWVIPTTESVLSYEHKLDFRKAMTVRKMRLRDNAGNITRVVEKRIVSMKHPDMAAISYSVTPENYEGDLTFRTGLDGTVENKGVDRYKELSSDHLTGIKASAFGSNGIFLHVRTNESGIDIMQASRLRIFSADREKRPRGKIIKKGKRAIFQDFVLPVQKKKTYTVEKYFTQRAVFEKNTKKNPAAVMNRIKRKVSRFDALARDHFEVWDDLWSLHDISVEGDDFTTKILRLHTFHLLQTACIHNESIDNGFPARGLSGESYRGHIFWDELFVLPYFAIHLPETVKAVLMYRYRRLGAARKYAEENGYEGAMFPWQSGLKGDEQTQTLHLNPLSGVWGPDHSRTQRHISFDIAYNFWQYWRKTEDHHFLDTYTSELMLSVAKFAASLVEYDENDGRYHTEGLMGPDEFHEKMPGSDKAGLKDNAYTNFLIVWTLLRAQEVINLIPTSQTERLMKKLDLSEEDLILWDNISRKMKIVLDADGVISQFDGYFDLKELNWDRYREKYGNIHRMDRILKAEGKSPNEYKVAKQADVLMIFYLLPLDEICSILKRLGYDFNKKLLRKNYDYYVRRTSHGSTLSKVVHCYVAHLLGIGKDAGKFFRDVLRSDIEDTQGGTTPEGIHCGVMGGSLDLTLRGFAGVHTPADGIVRITPKMPKNWKGINLRFLYKGDVVHLSVARKKVSLFIEPKGARFNSLKFYIKGSVRTLRTGRKYTFDL